jgi:hypothetical protein
MQLRKLIFLNIAFVLALFLYGLATDEPYWRDNGHGPWLYDYFLWALFLANGLAGACADPIAFLLGGGYDTRFLVSAALDPVRSTTRGSPAQSPRLR